VRTRGETRVGFLLTLLCLIPILVNLVQTRKDIAELKRHKALQVKTMNVSHHPKEPTEAAIKRVADKVITHLQQKDKLPGWKGVYR